MSTYQVTLGADWSTANHSWTVPSYVALGPFYIGPASGAPNPAPVNGASLVLNPFVANGPTIVTEVMASGHQLYFTDGGLYYDLSDQAVAIKAVGGTFGDRIETGSGNDTIDGGSGGDDIDGGDGNDTIDGGTGSDFLTGGAGADEFLFSGPGSGSDAVMDFVVGTDKVHISSAYGMTLAQILANIVDDGTGSAFFNLGTDNFTLLNVLPSALSANDIIVDNAAPTATITAASYAATEQLNLSLKGQLSVDDTDDGGSDVTVTLSVTSGILTVTAGTSGVTVTDSGTASVTLSGSIDEINDLLGANATSAVIFAANSDTPPASATLTLAINDEGHTGFGGAKTASDTATINIAAVNDAPTIAVQGSLDIAVAQQSSSVSVLLGNGSGGFGAASTVVAGVVSGAVALGDLNGDGTLDLLFANYLQSKVAVRLGDGTGAFAAPTEFAADFPRGIGLADFNGDGKLDLVATGINEVGVRLGDGNGGFGANTAYGTTSPPAAELGDIDGDGNLDILFAGSSGDVSILLGDGSGGFSAAAPFAANTGLRDIALGDLNGDGKLDLVTTNETANAVELWLGDGAGGFGPATSLAIGAAPWSLALGDVDGDGDLDILSGNFSDNTVSVLLGDGLGGFGTATSYAVGGGSLFATFGDVDGDGTLDIVVTTSTNAIDVLLGDGTGGFVAATSFPVSAAAYMAALGDIDNARVTDEDTAIVFDAAHGNAVTLDDADAGGGDQMLTLTVAHGTLTLATTAGLTSVLADGTATVRLVGSIAELNAAIDGLIYAPDENYNGTDELHITLDDGVAEPASSIVPIIVNAVNDAPTISAPSSIAVTEDQTAAVTGISIADVDAGSGTMAVSLSVGSGNGTLAATSGSGVTVANSGSSAIVLSGTISDINAFIAATNVSYAPATDINGDVMLTILVSDDGNTGSGGSQSDLETTFLRIAPVNDAPTIGAPASIAATEDQAVALTGLSFSDVDAGSGAVQALINAPADKGSFAAVSGGGVTVTFGGASAVALDGTLADINAFLAAGHLTFNPAANVNGDVALGIVIYDLGNTGPIPQVAAGSTTVAIAAVDDAPVLTLTPVLASLKETASTSSARKVADIAITDIDGGSNPLSLSGADKNLFVISNGDLYLKAGAKLDFETNPVLDVTVHAGASSAGLSLTITDVVEKLTGSGKSNHLTGHSWAEILDGRKGNDTISGKGGNDTIIGGAGADKLTGGGGADTFAFKPGDLPKVGAFDKWLSPLSGEYDLITDFRPGTDVIDLSALDANSRKAGNQAFHFKGEGERLEARGDLVTELYGSKPSARHTIIMGDVNGDGNYDFKIVLKGHHHLDAADFIL